MFCSRGLNNKINHVHERASTIIYNGKLSSYGELFPRDSTVTIHHINVRALAIEIYKVIHGDCPTLLNDEVLVPGQGNYDLRENNFLEGGKVKSVRYSTESILFLAPKIWEILPNEIKDSDTHANF